LLIVFAAWLVIALTAPRRATVASAEVPAPMPSPVEVSYALRQEYLTVIDGIERDYREGRLDARRAELELSRSVRRFVNEFSGLEAPVVALEDLVRLGVHPALIDAMGRHFYPSIFRRHPAIDPVAGADAARQVVKVWH